MPEELANILLDTQVVSKKTLEKARKRQIVDEKQLEDVLLEMGVLSPEELSEAKERLLHRRPADIARQNLGRYFVDAGIISEATLLKALKRQKSDDGRLENILLAMGVITETERIEALAHGFEFKSVTHFSRTTFDPKLLALLPIEIVLKYLIFPLRHDDTRVAIAMSDPFDQEAMDRVRSLTGRQVVAAIATRGDIFEAIALHYLGVRINPVPGDGILVADASTTAAAVVQAALLKEGFNVVIAGDGLEALKLALTERPRLILTDPQSRAGTGSYLLQALNATPYTRNTPVIMLTSRASAEDEKHAFDAGFFDFIAKPVQPSRIVARVRQALTVACQLQHVSWAVGRI